MYSTILRKFCNNYMERMNNERDLLFSLPEKPEIYKLYLQRNALYSFIVCLKWYSRLVIIIRKLHCFNNLKLHQTEEDSIAICVSEIT